MRALLPFVLLLGAGFPAEAAWAQDDVHPNTELQTGTRFAREPETAGAAEARWMQKRVAMCVFNRNRDEVRAILANSNFYSIDFDAVDHEPDTIFDDLEVSFCMGRLMRGADNETYRLYMNVPFSTLRNLLAEEAYLQDFDNAPAIGADSTQDVAGRFAGERVHPQVSTMAALADCLTFSGGAQAHELLVSRPGSDSELAAVDALGPILAACASSGEAELTVATSLLRQIAADGMWSRSHYALASVTGSGQ